MNSFGRYYANLKIILLVVFPLIDKHLQLNSKRKVLMQLIENNQ